MINMNYTLVHFKEYLIKYHWLCRYFIGTTMVVRAIRSISSGEEISENYGQIFTTTPESERKRKLRLQYFFDCNCEACREHWPLLEKIDPTILRFNSLLKTYEK